MGMFDNLICELPLPDGAPEFVLDQGHLFQTKSLDCGLLTYTLDAAGVLRLNGDRSHFSGLLEFYDSNVVACGYGFYFTREGEPAVHVDYAVLIENGQVIGPIQVTLESEPAINARAVNLLRLVAEEKDYPNQSEPPEVWTGQELFCMWGTIDPQERLEHGYSVRVMTDAGRQIGVSNAEGQLEMIHKSQWNNTLFSTREEAQRAIEHGARKHQEIVDLLQAMIQKGG